MTPFRANDPELLRLPDKEGYVEFITEIGLYDLIKFDIEELNDYVSAKFIRDEENCLEDIGYEVAPPGATFNGMVLIKVSASLNSWLAYQKSEEELDQVMAPKQP